MENAKKGNWFSELFKNTIFKGTLALVCVALGCGILIALANLVTSPIIEKQIEDKKIAQLESLFSGDFKPVPVGIDSFPSDDHKKIITNEYDEIKVNGETVGFVFYGKDKNQHGTIDLIVAFDVNGKIIGVKGISIEQTAGRDKSVEKMLNDYKDINVNDVNSVKQTVAGATVGFNTVKNVVSKIAETANSLNIFKEAA